jgi:DNA-binding SARP family transcriptional activator
MMAIADNWARPQSGSSEIAQWYYIGRGALTHQDWRTAQDAFTRAVVQLHDSAEWPLLWLSLIGLTTLSWRSENGAVALDHVREAHVLADRLEGIWPHVWSAWLLGHLYASHYQWGDAAACFTSIDHALDDQSEDQQVLRYLAIVASMLCAEGSNDPAMCLEQIFGLARLSLQFGLKRGLPLEALQGLASAPRLAVSPHAPASKQPIGPIEWLRQVLPRLDAGPPAVATRPAQPAARIPQALVSDAGARADASEPDRAYDLRAYCFGRFEFWVGHHLITQWSGAKSKALLKLLLAAFPSMVPATTLMGAIWPGVEEELARQRLHTAISDLRRALRSGRPESSSVIVSQNGSYGLDRQLRIWIDTIAFGQAQRAAAQFEQLGRAPEAQASYREAIMLYRGDFLEEDIYEDWPTDQRERYKNEYLMLLAHLSQHAFASQQYDACVNWGRLMLESDPCREDTHRLLMCCYSRQGQRSTALRQYRQCVDALRRELDAIPEAASEELYRRLQQGLDI